MSKQKTDEWGTPESIFRLIPTGDYFDPCPSYNQPRYIRHDNERVAIGRMHPDLGFIDGLTCHWGDLNFVNPPFSDIEPWIVRAAQEYALNGHKSILVIPDATDRKWYRRTVQALGCDVVWIGRHQFIPLNGQNVSGPAFGTGLVFIGFDESVIDRVIVSVTPPADSEAKRSTPSMPKLEPVGRIPETNQKPPSLS